MISYGNPVTFIWIEQDLKSVIKLNKGTYFPNIIQLQNVEGFREGCGVDS